MSYGFYVYTDRESIATTKVYSSQAGETYEYEYGTGQQHLEGFSDGTHLTFTAVPSSGYEFTRWVYHIGSPSAETQYSTSNPFKYYGSTDNDIYIAAEGQSTSGGGGTEEDEEWEIVRQTAGSVTSQKDIEITIEPMKIYRVSIMFNRGGVAEFYTSGSTDTVGFISDTSQFNYDVGEPLSILDRNDNISSSNRNFTLAINVTNDDGVLYIWVRGANLSTSGKTTLHIIPPTEDSEYFSWSSAVAQGLPIKNVSHTEWDNFIDKIIEVLTDKGIQNQPITEEKYGYAIGTTYLTMLQDCYMTYDADLEGYPLTAKQFNIARFIIGSHVSTGITEDKTAKTSKLMASEFITLQNCLKTWQG